MTPMFLKGAVIGWSPLRDFVCFFAGDVTHIAEKDMAARLKNAPPPIYA
jgi:hypothetical protein